MITLVTIIIITVIVIISIITIITIEQYLKLYNVILISLIYNIIHALYLQFSLLS